MLCRLRIYRVLIRLIFPIGATLYMIYWWNFLFYQRNLSDQHIYKVARHYFLKISKILIPLWQEINDVTLCFLNENFSQPMWIHVFMWGCEMYKNKMVQLYYWYMWNFLFKVKKSFNLYQIPIIRCLRTYDFKTGATLLLIYVTLTNFIYKNLWIPINTWSEQFNKKITIWK